MNGYTIVPSFGLMISDAKKIYITADSQFNPNQIKDFYRAADIIIQDCETAPYKSGVHAHYDELITLDTETKNKMYLWHYMDNVLEEGCGLRNISSDFQEKAIKDGFKGFLERGEEVEI